MFIKHNFNLRTSIYGDLNVFNNNVKYANLLKLLFKKNHYSNFEYNVLMIS